MNHYEILEISQTASSEVIRAAYKSLAQKYHPDKNNSAEAATKMAEINAAYDILSNPEKRQSYDYKLKKEKEEEIKKNAQNSYKKEEVKPNNASHAPKEEVKPKNNHVNDIKNKPQDLFKHNSIRESFLDKYKKRKLIKLKSKELFKNDLERRLTQDQQVLLSFLNNGYSVNQIYSQYIPSQDRKFISKKEFAQTLNKFFIIMNPKRKSKVQPIIIASICLAIIAAGFIPKVREYTLHGFNHVKKSIDKEIMIFKNSAEKNYSVGLRYYETGNHQEAITWFEAAANKEYIPAYTLLGKIYIETKEYSKAMEWFNLSANKNDFIAQFGLGMIYANGYGVKQDYSLAMKWYSLSANQGYSFAQNNLANLFELGLGVEKNHKKAVEFYTLAANQNHAVAQFNLALKYLKGEGVNQNNNEAIRLLKLSASQGFDQAKAKLKELNY